MSELAQLFSRLDGVCGSDGVISVLADGAFSQFEVGRDDHGRIYAGSDPADQRLLRVLLLRASKQGPVLVLLRTPGAGEQHLRGWWISRTPDVHVDGCAAQELAAILSLTDTQYDPNLRLHSA